MIGLGVGRWQERSHTTGSTSHQLTHSVLLPCVAYGDHNS